MMREASSRPMRTSHSSSSFHDSAAPLDARVEDLLARLSLDEKVSLLHQHCPPIPRLGIGYFHTGQEVLHGAAGQAGTIFPQAVGLAATWNCELVEAVGAAVAAEIRGFRAHDESVSLNAWGPVVNLLRDPRWGRNEEGYSEDPILTARLAAAYCRGLTRGEGKVDERVLATAPTLKSFLAYNHEAEVPRDISVRQRVLREYEIVPFLEALDASAVPSMMAAYGVTNGRPNHLSEYFSVVRDRFPDLYIVSDAYAPESLVAHGAYYEDKQHAYAAAVRAGLDSFTQDWADSEPTRAVLLDALALGLLAEQDVDQAVRRLLRMRLRTGEFDLDAPGPEIEPGDEGAHRALAREAVRQSLVLLRNDGILPLDPGSRGRIAVIGPMADRVCLDWYAPKPSYGVTPLQGMKDRLGADRVTFDSGLDRIRLRRLPDGAMLSVVGTEVTWEPDGTDSPHAQEFEVFEWGEDVLSLRAASTGLFLSFDKAGRLHCDQEAPRGWRVRETFTLTRLEDGWVLRSFHQGRYAVADGGTAVMSAADPHQAARLDLVVVSRGADTAQRIAREADMAVVLVGTHPQINGYEGRDRASLRLADGQEQLVRAVARANRNTVAVLVSGHPLAVPGIAQDAPAILWSSHGGPEFGNALADVLCGDHSPAGRLQQTWYRTDAELGDILDSDIIKSKKTYLYMEQEPLYPFGHGLSYATFTYAPPSLSTRRIASGGSLTVTMSITNTSATDADEVAQLYVRALDPHIPRPHKELKAFQRLRINAGCTAEVTFRLTASDFSFWDVVTGGYVLAPGGYELLLGPSSSAIEHRESVTVEAAPVAVRDVSSSLVRAVDFDDWEQAGIVDESRLRGEAIAARSQDAWLCFRQCELADGLDTFTATVGRIDHDEASIELRLDCPRTGPVLARIDVPDHPDARYGWTTVTTDLAALHAGRHDVYLVFSAPARIARFTATRRIAKPRGATGPAWPVGTDIWAADFDNWVAGRTTTVSKYHGRAVFVTEPGGWLLFRDVGLAQDATSLTATVGSVSAAAGAFIEVRLDDPREGELLGTLAVPESSDTDFGWSTVVAPLSAHEHATARVYLVFTAPARLMKFSFGRAAAAEEAGERA